MAQGSLKWDIFGIRTLGRMKLRKRIRDGSTTKTMSPMASIATFHHCHVSLTPMSRP